MDGKRIWTEKIGTKNFRRLQIIGFLLIGLLVFTGIASAEGGRIPKEPPTILAHFPETDAVYISIDSTISVVWDRPMQPDTDFAVTGPEGFVRGTFLYDADTYTVTFLPDEELSPDTRYGVLVAGQIDMEGKVQQVPYQWNFSTVVPTAVSIVSFGAADRNPEQSWWWSSWPWLMAAVSLLSLAGFLFIWGRRRFFSPVEIRSEF
ncbi:MAG: Ig-like domain-containing protein [Candidatus Promineifilaceae bacterium]